MLCEDVLSACLVLAKSCVSLCGYNSTKGSNDEEISFTYQLI